MCLVAQKSFEHCGVVSLRACFLDLCSFCSHRTRAGSSCLCDEHPAILVVHQHGASLDAGIHVWCVGYKGAEKLMGVSEALGCGFAMLGGYLGDELEVYGSAAPFVMQGSIAFLIVTTLGASLAHRHVTRDDLEANFEHSESESIFRRKNFRNQLAEGVKRIAVSQSTDSLAILERKYRQKQSAQLDRTLAKPLLAAGFSDVIAIS